jgi:hypothetical protein
MGLGLESEFLTMIRSEHSILLPLSRSFKTTRLRKGRIASTSGVLGHCDMLLIVEKVFILRPKTSMHQ